MTDSVKIFTVAAGLDGVTFRRDSSMGIRFVTKELPADEKLILMDFYPSYGYLQYSLHPINELPIKAPPKDTSKMTNSQEVRYLLMQLYDKRQPSETFEIFYEHEMSKVKDAIRKQLSS